MKKIFKHSYFSFFLKITALLVAFGYIGKVVVKNWDKLQNTSISFNISYLFWSFSILFLSYLSACIAWFIILKALRINSSYLLAQHNWLLSNFGKYIPGSIWTISARTYLHSAHKHSSKAIISASLLEAILSLSVSVVAVLMLMIYLNKISVYPGVFFILLIIFCFFMSHNIINKGLNLVLSFLNKEAFTYEIDVKVKVNILIAYFISFIARGYGFFLYIKSIDTSFPDYFLYAFFCLAFSNLAGGLLTSAPKGIGVREALLIYLLSSVLAEPFAILISISFRLWIIGIELLLTFVSYIFIRLQSTSNQAKIDEPIDHKMT